jgi:peptidoglycan/LPS O-acetylase OafA/YrhL
VLTVAAGYAAPPLAGLGAAWLLSSGHVTALLWAVLVFLAAAFAAIRNAFGVVAVLAVAGLVYVVSRYASVAAQDAFAFLFTWFLLFGGVRAVTELRRRRRGGWDPRTDADQLARLTGVPAGAWVALFTVLGLAALAGSVLLIAPLPALPA